VSDLIVARDLVAAKASPQEIARRIARGNAGMAGRLVEAARRYRGDELDAMLIGLWEADVAIKSNEMDEGAGAGRVARRARPRPSVAGSSPHRGVGASPLSVSRHQSAPSGVECLVHQDVKRLSHPHVRLPVPCGPIPWTSDTQDAIPVEIVH
jgi:hypothetical protein